MAGVKIIKFILLGLFLLNNYVLAGSNVSINSPQTILNDMNLKNDAVLAGYETRGVGWYVGPGSVVVGNLPLTTHTPLWYKSIWDGYPEQELKAILPWAVVFDGVGNKATNVRVEIADIKAYLLPCDTKIWSLVSYRKYPEGAEFYKDGINNIVRPENVRINSNGFVEIKPTTDSLTIWHGWGTMARIPNTYNICAWFVTLKSRLVVDNSALPDDRSISQYLLHIGADYYPDVGVSWSVLGHSINPGVGVSRAKLLTSQWQAFNFITLTDVGDQQMPPIGISTSQFLNNLPPLE